MSVSYPGNAPFEEPQRRFYPTQGANTEEQPQIPSAPTPITAMQQQTRTRRRNPRGPESDAAYFGQRSPLLMQRLFETADAFLDTYPANAFIYDAYPDYLSLTLLRDRLLRENSPLTENFLQEGCPIPWLNILTDTVISELLCRKRRAYRKPNGDANTTSVRFASRS